MEDSWNERAQPPNPILSVALLSDMTVTVLLILLRMMTVMLAGWSRTTTRIICQLFNRAAWNKCPFNPFKFGHICIPCRGYHSMSECQQASQPPLPKFSRPNYRLKNTQCLDGSWDRFESYIWFLYNYLNRQDIWKFSNLRKKVGIAIKIKETSIQLEPIQNSYVAIMH